MGKTVVIGGGAAGMMAAIFAARNGNQVELFEKNEKLGKKIYITGKGRCNLTNSCDMEELLDSVVTNKKFLYSSFYGFTNEETMEFFREIGLKMKTERGNRVFPESDHSSDVIRVLGDELKRQGVQVHLNTKVQQIGTKDGAFACLYLADGTEVQADTCIIATGGNSYQTTGSTGDGYRFAKTLGHTVTSIRPALVPMETKEAFVKDLQGLSLKNTAITILDGSKVLYEDFGEMLFTHYGVSGPMILSASSFVGKILEERPLRLRIDLKPALSFEQLDARLLRDFEENKNKQFKNALARLLPAKMIPVAVEQSRIHPEKKIHEITREERLAFAALLKGLELTITGLRDFNEAIITQGGVNVREINPATMESRLVKHVHFAGEVLDLDAVTGGFNLQIAWSTGNAAGSCASEE